MTNYDRLRANLIQLGMDYKISRSFVDKLKEDEESFVVDLDQKRVALESGFFPGRIALYGEDHFKDYLPDFQYYMMHPYNHHFKIWINDKLTLKYILSSSELYDLMPEYYLYIENDGSYTYLMDSPPDIAKDEKYLLNLLERKKVLVLKPNSSTSGGLGFIKLEFKEGNIYENNKCISVHQLNDIRDSLHNYVVTEYVNQHGDLNKIWDKSECTLRVIMCKDEKGKYESDNWSCVASFARFGTEISGGTSNLVSGGIGIRFNFETGKYNDTGIRYKKFTNDGNWILRRHPDSSQSWLGQTLPNWGGKTKN